MTLFHFHADLDDPLELVAAVAEAAGEEDVRLVHSWNGYDRESGDMIEPQQTGAVYIEWLRRQGRFSLDVQVYGARLAPRQTSARFARAVAKSLRRSVLFNDCSPYPFSYVSAEPDGSIWLQIVIDDDTDVMDLDAYDHEDPSLRRPRLVFGPDEPLPERPAGSPVSWRHGDPVCETRGPQDLCWAFCTPCPKRRPLQWSQPSAIDVP